MTPNTPNPPRTGPTYILKPVLAYLVGACLWIVLSDQAVGWLFADPAVMVFANSLKGWLFVGVTSGLLFLLLTRRDKVWREAGAVPRPTGSASNTLTLRLILLALVWVVPLIGLTFYKTQTPQMEAEAAKSLQGINQLKAAQIEHWLVERDGDAQVLKAATDLGQQIEALSLGKADEHARYALLERLQAWHKNFGYASILVLAPSGQVLMARGEHQQMPPTSRDLAALAFDSAQVLRGQLYRDDDGDIHLEWVVPVQASKPLGGKPVAAFLLRVKATDYLFPLINTWPVASDSGETMLVRRRGNAVHYVNETRFRKDTAQFQSANVTDLNLPAARAVLANEPGTTQGFDYRGADVLAAYRPIAGTDWRIVSKVDRAEVLAPMWRSLYWVSLIGLAAVAAIMLALWLLWQQQRHAQTFELQAEKSKADRLLTALIDHSTDVIFIKDLQGRYTQANPEVARVMGKSLPQLLGQDDAALFPEQASNLQANDRQVMAENKVFTLEEETTTVDGLRTFLATKGPLHDEMGRVIGLFGISRDITERKQTELAMQQHALFVQAILDSVSAEIAVLDKHGVILAVNQPWQRFATENGLAPGQPAPCTGVGASYLAACAAPPGQDNDRGLGAVEGIQAVIDGRLPSFTLEYTCHSPKEQRWFSMSVTPLGQSGQGVVVAHTNISERMQAAAQAQQRNEELARFNRVAVGRELDMIRLKQQVNALAEQLGQPAPHALAFLQAHP